MITHIAYSDESNWDSGAYRSICMISGAAKDMKAAEKKISAALKDAGVGHFTWSGFKDTRLKPSAEKIISSILPYCVKGLIRIDIIIWDIKDNRHRITRKDDGKNLGRMYYHLFLNVLKDKWPEGAVWKLCPHERDQMDWGQLQETLDHSSAKFRENDLFIGEKSAVPVKKENAYEVEDIQKCSPEKTAMLQAADLFAGMACYSRLEYARFTDWLDENDNQMTMFDLNFKNFNNTHKARFCVMKDFHDACVKSGLGVGLRSYGCFYTADPKNPVNFWWYTPQHILDKAPTRFKLTELKDKEL